MGAKITINKLFKQYRVLAFAARVTDDVSPAKKKKIRKENRSNKTVVFYYYYYYYYY